MEWTRTDVAVPTRSPTGETAVYLAGASDALLIDPAAQTRTVADRSVAHVALTHHHPDHTAALTHYTQETEATVWARRGRGAAFEAATGTTPDRTFAEGTVIPAGEGGVTVLDTPGHAPEHVAFAADGTVATGDLAVASGSVTVGAPEGDIRAYLCSLRRLHARNPDRLLPSHGPTITDARSVCRRLIAHRLDRECRIRQAVEAGAWTLEEILTAAYEKDLTGVRDLAGATVRAHLEKLAVEGTVRWDGERATPA